MSTNKNVVVSQALYLNQHRKKIQERFARYDIEFVEIEAPLENQIKQLGMRVNAKKWISFAKENDPYFQSPDAILKAHKIINHTDKNQLALDLMKLPFRNPASTVNAVATAGIMGSAEAKPLKIDAKEHSGKVVSVKSVESTIKVVAAAGIFGSADAKSMKIDAKQVSGTVGSEKSAATSNRTCFTC